MQRLVHAARGAGSGSGVGRRQGLRARAELARGLAPGSGLGAEREAMRMLRGRMRHV